MIRPAPGPLSGSWLLDPSVSYLNHGSFGACPRPVLEQQQLLRERLERQPVKFLDRELTGLLDAARGELAAFLNIEPVDLSFVPNATYAVNAVLRSLRLGPADELLVTDHEYNACRQAIDYVALRSKARVVVAELPFPIRGPEQVLEAVLERITPATRLALLDHVTSPTALVLPLERLIVELQARGVDVLADGAHAPGMLPLELHALGAAYYTGNCHKWLCAPKGAAFLHVRRDRQALIHPLSISHGYSADPIDRGRFRLEFDWTGTHDPTAWLAVPAALKFMAGLFPGGWPELMRRNHELTLRARDLLAAALHIEPPCPDQMLGSMAALPLPAGQPLAPGGRDPLQTALYERFGIEVPVTRAAGLRLLRISAQAYNSLEQYQYLAEALGEMIE